MMTTMAMSGTPRPAKADADAVASKSTRAAAGRIKLADVRAKAQQELHQKRQQQEAAPADATSTGAMPKLRPLSDAGQAEQQRSIGNRERRRQRQLQRQRKAEKAAAVVAARQASGELMWRQGLWAEFCAVGLLELDLGLDDYTSSDGSVMQQEQQQPVNDEDAALDTAASAPQAAVGVVLRDAAPSASLAELREQRKRIALAAAARSSTTDNSNISSANDDGDPANAGKAHIVSHLHLELDTDQRHEDGQHDESEVIEEIKEEEQVVLQSASLLTVVACAHDGSTVFISAPSGEELWTTAGQPVVACVAGRIGVG
jgi:hypothetical protein